MSRIRGPYVRFCKRDEAATPHPTCCLPSEAGKPVGLKEARIALTEGKIIRIAMALLANGRV
ncbi:hypothetical protein ABMY16_22270, partial [Vibrio vulnificus]|uniref:hypothetical protein n=1 Tax=Vibrio vulnificus TaxID=672 RepID=UPI0040582F60